MSEEKKDQVLNQDQAISEQELSDVTGGGICACPLVGGGTANQPGEKACACVVGGGGQYNAEGQAAVGTDTRCTCVLGGGGRSRADDDESIAKCGCYSGGVGD